MTRISEVRIIPHNLFEVIFERKVVRSESPTLGSEKVKKSDTGHSVFIGDIRDLLVLLNYTGTSASLFSYNDYVIHLRMSDNERVTVVLLSLYPSWMGTGNFGYDRELSVCGFAHEPRNAFHPRSKIVISAVQLFLGNFAHTYVAASDSGFH